MKVESNMIVYRLNYGHMEPEDVPSKVSVCRLFWRTAARLLGFVLGFPLFYLVATPIRFLFAEGPKNFVRWYFFDRRASPFEPIAWLPEYEEGKKVWPIIALGALIALIAAVGVIGTITGVLLAFWVVLFTAGFDAIPVSGESFFAFFVSGLVSLLLVGLMLYQLIPVIPGKKMLMAIKNSSLVELCREAFRGWKEKFCPMVEIVKPVDSHK